MFYVGEEMEFMFGKGSAFFAKSPVALYGMTRVRMVDDVGKKWFEFGFEIDMTGMGGGMIGNSGAGWTDPGNYLRLEAQWSDDLVAWQLGKFWPAPVPVVSLGADVYQYWGRAWHPQDAAVKTGALFFSNNSNDTRVNGFTSLVIAGVSVALGGFPYNMAIAGTAARLQADIRTAGFAGAVVTGTTALNWTISIPSVNYTSYSQNSWVGFPGFLTANIFGEVVNLVDKAIASGTFVDGDGVAIFRKAFARLKITAGTRYDPYL